MGALGITEYVASVEVGYEAERRELDWLLTSGVLGRSGNLARVLTYICEERFAGRGQQIKEYTIATEALGRRAEFDPNSDTIVRVTVHSLRKRLQEVYQSEGASRPMRLVLPPGHYEPCFLPTPIVEEMRLPLPVREVEAVEHAVEPVGAAVVEPAAVPAAALEADSGARGLLRRVWLRWLGMIVVAGAIAALVVLAVRHGDAARSGSAAAAAAALAPPVPQPAYRALMGAGRKPYVDHSGRTWVGGNYCQTGENIAVSPRTIAGTNDAPLYFGGVRGIAHCVFPVTQKLYELHFHFAEASNLAPATSSVLLSINAGPSIKIDVVDAAGGDGIATSTVVTGVAPESDGAIHVDFTSDVSVLSAVEILPAPSASLLPVRIVASPKPYVDGENQFWESDRYFNGGRYGMAPGSEKQGNLGLYGSDRLGRFRYSIPAVPMAHYRVRLYFREAWFGKENGGGGGVGSRVFDVACNGEMLLKNFDILAAGGYLPVVKEFNNVQASADGRIEISFLPVANYAVVNAIEVLPAD